MIRIKLFIACFIYIFLIPSLLNAFCFETAGDAYGINPHLLESIAKTESNLKPTAINKNQNGSIDMGLMQINSLWIKELGLDPERLISDPCYNVKAGARILKSCINKYGYTWEAVGCYNAVTHTKRVNYSWKVFNILYERKKKLTEEEVKSIEQKAKDITQSLLFSVKDNAAIK
ncbi:MAG: lytic transglycosylase domain-containing protein [Nitrospirota bacterium]